MLDATTNSQAPTQPLTRQEIVEAQRLLLQRGYPIGQVDGVVGPRTRAAVRGFQQASGLAANGQLDTRVLSALRGSTRPEVVEQCHGHKDCD